MLKKYYKLVLKCLLVLPFILLLDFCGIFSHLCELDFETYYYYPAHNNNDVQVEYKFLQMPTEPNKLDPPRLTLIIKSAISNLQRRDAIRKTWGYESRFSDVHIRRVFLLGVTAEGAHSGDAVETEAKNNGDIMRGDFVDTYSNNTIKTMMGLRWATLHFNTSDFYMFVDDDYYVSVKNVLRFLGNSHTTYQELLFAGYVFQTSPLRHKFSKWYISLEEYPFNKWPPYVTAGAFILSRAALIKLFTVGRTLPLFRFDDIHLGILALKAHIPLHHCANFHFHRPVYYGPDSYSDIIATHGFSDPVEMEHIWNQCRSANYA